MPSDEMVEKVARAIPEADLALLQRAAERAYSDYLRAFHPQGEPDDGPVTARNRFHVSLQDFQHIASPTVIRQLVSELRHHRAALAAAEAGEQPVYRYQTPDHRSFSQTTPPMPWQGDYTPVTIRAGTVASPPSEASRDERAAIRKEAFEEAALIADAQAVSDHGDWCNAKPEDKAYHLWAKQTAQAIATAIRARGET